MKPIKFATVFGTDLHTSQTGFLSSLILWVMLVLVGLYGLSLSPVEALVGGFLAVVLHWVNAFGHHLGHAFAARQVGYPMVFIRMFYLMCGEKYPKDEPELPPEIHIKRALGGPAASLILAFVGFLIVLLLPAVPGLIYYLTLFFALENLLVFCLGSFLPLGFTDGSTLLYWVPRYRMSRQ